MPETCSHTDLNCGFDFPESGQGIKHHVYRLGEGPPVILLHELPGMTPEFLAFARRIADCKFTLYLPHFFGPVGKWDTPSGILYCLRHEFRVFSANDDSPIANWLRALCRKVDEDHGKFGVGVIGLCLTGNIVMSAMVLDCVRLGVMGEPALPFTNKAALGVPDADVEATALRAKVYPMLAYRFSSDKKCSSERFETLKNKFGDGIRLTEICTGTLPWEIPNGSHQVFTSKKDAIPSVDDPNHPVQHAIDEVLAELRLRLKTI